MIKFELWFLAFMSFVLGAAAPIMAEQESPTSAQSESAFLQIKADSAGRPSTMSTSIVRFAGTYSGPGQKTAVPVSVDLVSAVHIAEPEYYQELNKRFTAYDAVLFELIAPDDLSMKERKALQAREKSATNPISLVQQSLQKALGLEFQLEKIDYSKGNFVHADLSPEGFNKSLEARGDSIWSLISRLLIQGFVEEQKRENPLESLLLLTAFVTSTDAARPFVLRRYLAENFRSLDSLVEKIEGPQGSTLVADRNQRALDVLKVQLAKGKKKFAIFYGAAHMPKFQESLERDFGLRRTTIEWVHAWHLQPPAAAGAQ